MKGSSEHCDFKLFHCKFVSGRFECNNRIKFALEQERLTHEAALKQQRLDLLKMFQKDREELIEVSKTELETMTKKLTNEHEMKRAREIERSVEMVELSASKKINELSKRIGMLEGELVEKEAMITSEVECVYVLFTN